MKVLDPCCGGKMFWFDKNDKRVLFLDKRSESHILCDGRKFNVKPDLIADFTILPFAKNKFKLVVFDPPHFKYLGEKSWLYKKYGALPKDNWKEIIKLGFKECFRVLQKKWNTYIQMERGSNIYI